VTTSFSGFKSKDAQRQFERVHSGIHPDHISNAEPFGECVFELFESSA
jgi:hypothetical protein